ncbi:hypothetical protein BZL30_4274 [Mycobacterium kansasii]|uniref:Uncharacterized protein n=1 Tax=Mycobacterium kansasii TaxID=1768 RepID=A0A1V3XAQ2_MYCKA|nr:hypothetical protein BZL30_4274 [Mycobacterium kansasii]
MTGYPEQIFAVEFRLQNAVVRPANVVAGGKGLFDDLQSMVHPGLELEHHTAITDGLRFENYVPLTTTVDIGDRVTRVQIFDGHQFRGSV